MAKTTSMTTAQVASVKNYYEVTVEKVEDAFANLTAMYEGSADLNHGKVLAVHYMQVTNKLKMMADKLDTVQVPENVASFAATVEDVNALNEVIQSLDELNSEIDRMID